LYPLSHSSWFHSSNFAFLIKALHVSQHRILLIFFLRNICSSAFKTGELSLVLFVCHVHFVNACKRGCFFFIELINSFSPSPFPSQTTLTLPSSILREPRHIKRIHDVLDERSESCYLHISFYPDVCSFYLSTNEYSFSFSTGFLFLQLQKKKKCRGIKKLPSKFLYLFLPFAFCPALPLLPSQHQICNC